MIDFQKILFKLKKKNIKTIQYILRPTLVPDTQRQFKDESNLYMFSLSLGRHRLCRQESRAVLPPIKKRTGWELRQWEYNLISLPLRSSDKKHNLPAKGDWKKREKCSHQLLHLFCVFNPIFSSIIILIFSCKTL